MVEHKHFNQQRAVQYYADILSSLFGSFSNEAMQSCFVRRVSLSLSSSSASSSSVLASASVYSPPSDRFDYRSFISYKYMQLCP